MRQHPHSAPRVTLTGASVAAVVSGLAAGGSAVDQPLLVVPFALTAVLALTATESPLAQPRSIVGGYLSAAAVATALTELPLPHALAAGAAVGVTVALGLALGLLHPPAAALALLLSQQDAADAGRAAVAVAAAGALALALVAVNRLLLGRAYAAFW
jgi:CBS domain-containing membrane protein